MSIVKTLPLQLAPICLALLLSACGSGTDDSSSDSSASEPQASSSVESTSSAESTSSVSSVAENSSSTESTSSVSSVAESSSSAAPVALDGPLWSDPATWPSNAVPAEGDSVTIDEGMNVILDVSPPTLAGLTVEGTLSFGDNDDIELTTEWIAVSGELYIGTAEAPYSHNATITLVDNVPGEELGNMGDRGIMVMGGTLNMHGNRQNAWTKLAATAEAGSTEIEVLDASQWLVGDEIVLASTDFNPRQAEQRTISAIDGNMITLDEALEYMHYGEITFEVDQRGEVGLLSRNIVIQASDDAETSYFGGHIMAMAGGEMYVSGVELNRMGQHLELGRYPIHWHIVGEGEGQYIENSAIHGTYNRCVTLHATNNVRVENNVSYNNVGHCYFLEDANETGNQLISNLGIMTKCHPTLDCDPTNSVNQGTTGQSSDNVLIPSDNTVSTFWITNPDNIFRDNVAAGSDQIGYWIALPEHPTGASENLPESQNIWPRRTQLREFSGNIAHSNFDGFMFDRGPTPEGNFDVVGNTHLAYADPTDTSSEQLETVIENFVAYKNSNNAFWGRGENHVFVGMQLADNAIGYTHAFPGGDFGGAPFTSQIVDSLFVGETDNIGNPTTADEIAYGRSLPKPEADYPIRGFEYYDVGHHLENVKFVNYEDNETRNTGAISYLLFTNFGISTENSVEGLSFENAKPVYFPELDLRWAFEQENMDGFKGAVIHDIDGSLSGVEDSYVVRDNGIASDDSCEIKPTWNAAVCQGDYGRISFTDLSGGFSFGGGDSGSMILSRNGRELEVQGLSFFGGIGKETTVRAGTEITVETAAASTPLVLTEFDAGSWVIFELPGFTSSDSGAQVSSLDALRNATETSYFVGDGSLWVKHFSQGGGNALGGGTTINVSR